MSETSLRNADIDAALNEAKEAYVTRNPNSLARYVEATARHARRQHPHGAALRPVPAGDDPRGRLPDVGRRRRTNTSISWANTPPASTATPIR